MTFNWSKKPFIYGAVYATLVIVLYAVFQIDFFLPWQPVSIVGIAVAFYLGFKNNSSYDRTWEARKIWGAIVNSSRSFGAAVRAFIEMPEEDVRNETVRKIIYRHIAWLTALRFQLRLGREWEHKEDRIRKLFIETECAEYFSDLNSHLAGYIGEEEMTSYKNKSNIAAQILATQSMHLSMLNKEGYLNNFRHKHLSELLDAFYTDQGKSERIKNFPFPRQYASTALWMSFVFAALLPFGLISIFIETERVMAWAVIPFNALITWVFFLMEKIGDYSENPFEGTYNDVPISSIANTIEIDLREMIDDDDIPPAMIPKDGFLL